MPRLRIALFVALFALGPFVVMWVLGEVITRVALARVESEGWPVEGGSIDNAFAAFRFGPTNESARALERIVRGLGVELRTFDERRVNPLPKDASNEAQARYDEAKTYLRDAFMDSSGVPDALPEALASYLDRHVETLDRVVTELSKGPEPWWKADAPRYSEDSIPGLVGHVQLSTLEVAQALRDGREGKHAIAWERLHAVARLSDGIGRRRELISQMISLVEARHVCGAMRKMEAPVPSWVTAWRANGYRREVAWTFAIESSLVASLVHGFPKDIWNRTLPEDQRQPSVIRYAVSFVLAPCFRASVVNMLLAERSIAHRLQANTDCTGRNTLGPAELPEWNVFGKRVIKDLDYEHAWQRADAFESELYASKLILATKQRRFEDGRWPAERPEVPTTCKPNDWIYAAQIEGFSLKHSEPFELEQQIPMAEEYVEGVARARLR